MPRKTDGIEIEIHPRPTKGEDGKPLLYVRPAKGRKKSFKQLATDYLRYCYGVDSLDKLPKDLVTKESYLKAVDEESLYGGYQLDAVKEKLYELNKQHITYVEVDTDGEKIEKTEE